MSHVSNTALFQLTGYDLHHIDRKDKRGGGVAIYVCNTLKYSVSNDMGFAMTNVLECITIKVSVPNKKIVLISCMYRQPDSSVEVLCDTLEKLYRHKRCNVYLCGDFNLNLLNCEHSNHVHDF